MWCFGKRNVIGEIREMGEHEVLWCIDNCFSIQDKNGLYSPEFDLEHKTWQLKIFLNGQDKFTKQKGYVGLYICTKKCENESTAPMKLKCMISILTEKEGKSSLENRCLFRKLICGKKENIGTPIFILKTDLLKRRNQLAPSDRMAINCVIITTPCSTKRNESSSDLTAEMLIEPESRPDVHLKVAGKVLLAHKFVLESRSSVFSAMFEVEGNDNGICIVKIPNGNLEAYKQFLQFIYFKKLENISSIVFELFEIADKYNVYDLKSECRTFIVNNLSLENLVDVVILSEKFNEVNMKRKAQEFFNVNFGQIVSNEKWKNFMKDYNHLASTLLKDLASKGYPTAEH